MPPELNIYISNRLEILARQLALIVKAPLPSAVAPEMIVVQSRGMERWVSLALARHNGICANCAFPFPNTFLEQMTTALIPNLPDQNLFTADALTFRIMQILPDCVKSSGFESLKTYLENDDKDLKLIQISNKIAELFDQYLVFRPQMIFSWEKGRETHWQAQLWRRLVNSAEPMHRARLQTEFIKKILNVQKDTDNLPSRVSVFGISYLPSFYLQVFEALSKVVQVNFFMMNPCQEYWADIASDREIKRIRKTYLGADETDADLYLEKGNRLLASMGTLGRNFFRLISELDGHIYEQFEKPLDTNVLAGIQADILTLTDREIAAEPEISEVKTEPGQLKPDSDNSIQVHSCHSPLREIEVLHDNLLAMFEQNQDLAPQDIIVMTPDIESYGPYIQAVFDAQIDDRLKIPFSIADQGVRKLSRNVDGFFSILNLAGSRLTVTDVMALLEFKSIKDKFSLAEADIQTIERWIKATHIRWGADADSRRKFGLPKYPENTWQAGINRLLLGYAMPGNDCRMFSGILPYDHIEGGDVNILGKFADFLEQVFGSVNTIQQKHIPADWNTILTDILNRFFEADEASEPEMQLLRRLFDSLSENQELSGFNKPLAIEAVKFYLESLLEHEPFGAGFITSGVTFCAMLPMRSIPFKVVCLVGMDTDAFPRQSKPVSFDLMAQKPKIGDRSRRNDDKYMFLEAIISARRQLYISYVGQSIKDNTQSPPSVLVSELLDYLEAGFGRTADRVIRRHKLQAFSPEYFQPDSRLFSYSRENFDAVSRQHAVRKAAPLISKPLEAPGIEWKNIAIDDLCAFFSNPAKFLLEKRLGIYLTETKTFSEDREIFNPDGLQRYLLDQDLVKERLCGLDLKDRLPLYRARGELPHGNVGDLFYKKISSDAEAFVRKIKSHVTTEPPKAQKVDLQIAGFDLDGRLSEIYKDALIQIRYVNTKPKYLLNTWIYHLVLCELDEVENPATSLLICKDNIIEFSKVTNSSKLLEDLFGLYWQGLTLPLPFFPEVSYEYARNIQVKKQSSAVALKSAQNKWLGSDFSRGVSKDPYYELCFREIEPFDNAFEQTALDVFAPLLDHCTESVL